jgi:hypothetical protein
MARDGAERVAESCAGRDGSSDAADMRRNAAMVVTILIGSTILAAE